MLNPPNIVCCPQLLLLHVLIIEIFTAWVTNRSNQKKRGSQSSWTSQSGNAILFWGYDVHAGLESRSHLRGEKGKPGVGSAGSAPLLRPGWDANASDTLGDAVMPRSPGRLQKTLRTNTGQSKVVLLSSEDRTHWSSNCVISSLLSGW